MRIFESRQDPLGSCPVCGRQVRRRDERVRAWPGKYAHQRCAGYRRGRGHSHRVYGSFTAP